LESYGLKDEIINFVLNSPEEVNSKVAIFIAGMQAQKNMMSYGLETDEYKRMAKGNCFIELHPSREK